jgi:hypothetical protein
MRLTFLPQPEDNITFLWFVDTDEDPGTGLGAITVDGNLVTIEI